MARTIDANSRLFEDIIDVLNMGIMPRPGDEWQPKTHRDVDAFSENHMISVYLPRVERDVAIVVSRRLADGEVSVSLDFRMPSDGECDEKLPHIILSKPTAKLASDVAATLIEDAHHLI